MQYMEEGPGDGGSQDCHTFVRMCVTGAQMSGHPPELLRDAAMCDSIHAHALVCAMDPSGAHLLTTVPSPTVGLMTASRAVAGAAMLQKSRQYASSISDSWARSWYASSAVGMLAPAAQQRGAERVPWEGAMQVKGCAKTLAEAAWGTAMLRGEPGSPQKLPCWHPEMLLGCAKHCVAKVRLGEGRVEA